MIGTTLLQHSSRTAQQFHDDIQQSLGSRTHRRGTFAPATEEALKSAGSAAWTFMKRHPFATCTAIAAGAAAAAAAVGVAELTFGGALALAAYKILREGEPPLEAVEELEHIGGE